VRTAQDLAVKAAAERQYLIFNLLAGGKLAWDTGDFRDRRQQVGGAAACPRAGSRSREGDPTAGARGAHARRRAAVHRPARGGDAARAAAAASGSATRMPSVPRRRSARSAARCRAAAPGAGRRGDLLKRVGGETPRPAPARGKVVTQRNKTFMPRVLAVTVGPR
jgi:hypothetical protein